MNADDDLLAAAWLENCRAATMFGPESEQATNTFWAYELLDQMCAAQPARALAVIRLMVKLRPSEREFYNIAAGPLEDLLVRHGSAVLEQVEEAASSDVEFLDLLGGVWFDRVTPQVRSRLKALVDKAEFRLDRRGGPH